jgi:hypothetical protein
MQATSLSLSDSVVMDAVTHHVRLRRSTPMNISNLETALESHICMVDPRRSMALDVMFRPKLLLYGLR